MIGVVVGVEDGLNRFVRDLSHLGESEGGPLTRYAGVVDDQAIVTFDENHVANPPARDVNRPDRMRPSFIGPRLLREELPML